GYQTACNSGLLYRLTYGNIGAYLPVLFLAALTIGWQGIVVGAFGLTWAGSFDSPLFYPIALFAGVLYTLTTLYGVKGLEKVAVPSTVVLALVGIYAGWFNVDKAGGWQAFLELSKTASTKQPLSDTDAINIVIGSWVVGGVVMAEYTRFARKAWVAIAIPFVVVSCSGSKLLTYILPIYPSLALTLAVWLGGEVCPRCEKIGWGFALISLGVLGPMLWCVRYVWSEAAEVTPSPGYLLGATLLAIILVLVWGIKIRKGDMLAKVGWVAGVAIFLWHGASWEMERINDLLGRQASVRSLARLVEKHQPERVFIYRARAAGLLFSADRKVWTNRADADVVVEPSSETKGRFFEKPKQLREGLNSGQRVEGITLRHVFREEFDSKEWEVTGRAGEFLLIRGYGVEK
ncbi:MAG: hypothetical protein EBU36_06385, partial [Verrucomicrobia bacterium]|nr:hypothetical protein [Verrucomicrobiota bacterium]